VTFSYASSLGTTWGPAGASVSASVDAMRVRIRVERESPRRAGREREVWSASMLVGAEAERRSDSAKAFLLKDGMVVDSWN